MAKVDDLIAAVALADDNLVKANRAVYDAQRAVDAAEAAKGKAVAALDANVEDMINRAKKV